MKICSPDVIIVEDDPYYFLQFSDINKAGSSDSAQFLASLAPSYLKCVLEKKWCAVFAHDDPGLTPKAV